MTSSLNLKCHFKRSYLEDLQIRCILGRLSAVTHSLICLPRKSKSYFSYLETGLALVACLTKRMWLKELSRTSLCPCLLEYSLWGNQLSCKKSDYQKTTILRTPCWPHGEVVCRKTGRCPSNLAILAIPAQASDPSKEAILGSRLAPGDRTWRSTEESNWQPESRIWFRLNNWSHL